MAEEYLVLVDQNDNAIGLEEKIRCHLPDGLLHRAFTALLFDKEGKLLLTKRSPNKMLWPGYWDGTVASHPYESESYVSSAQRRMPQELGLSCKIDYLNKFEYHIPYKDLGSENEICATLMGVVDSPSAINPVEGEISEMRWVEFSQLQEDLLKNPQEYCPWMILAIYFLPSSDQATLNKHKSVLSDWLNPQDKKPFEESIKYHFSVNNNNWRLINK